MTTHRQRSTSHHSSTSAHQSKRLEIDQQIAYYEQEAEQLTTALADLQRRYTRAQNRASHDRTQRLHEAQHQLFVIEQTPPPQQSWQDYRLRRIDHLRALTLAEQRLWTRHRRFWRGLLLTALLCGLLLWIGVSWLVVTGCVILLFLFTRPLRNNQAQIRLQAEHDYRTLRHQASTTLIHCQRDCRDPRETSEERDARFALTEHQRTLRMVQHRLGELHARAQAYQLLAPRPANKAERRAFTTQ